jgi:hypothetical protein
MFGSSQRKIGAMMREEWLNDMRSLEAEKMTAIQIKTGSQ